jgi:hypothetical protein
MTILERIKLPTPVFYKRLRTIGLSLAAVGGALLASPIVLPATLVTVAGYLTVVGSVIGAISQTVTAE